MAKKQPDIERLLDEFKAQDMSTSMIAVVSGKNVTVATFSEGNQNWQLTDEGRDLLYPPEVEAVVTEKPKNINVRDPRQRPPAVQKA